MILFNIEGLSSAPLLGKFKSGPRILSGLCQLVHGEFDHQAHGSCEEGSKGVVGPSTMAISTIG